MTDIMILSANDNVRTNLQKFLTESGYKVGAVGAVRIALEAMKSRPPRLILATYDGGVEDVDRVFEAAKKARIAFLVIAESKNRDHAVKLMSAGSSGYILEPVNVNELKVMIDRGLDNVVNSARRFTFDVLSSLEDGFLVLNATGKVMFANPMACELFGAEATEMRGRSVTEIGSATLEELVDRTAEKAEPCGLENLTIGPENRVVAAQAAAVFDAREKRAGFTIKLRPLDGEEGGSAALIGLRALQIDLKELEARPQSGLSWARLRAVLDAIDELSRPLVKEPISVLVAEMVEIAARRAALQVPDARGLDIQLASGDLRLECRRRCVEAMLTQILVSALQCGDVKLRAGMEERELVIEVQDGGPPITDEGTEERAGCPPERAPLVYARLLAEHHGAAFEPAEEAPALRVVFGET